MTCLTKIIATLGPAAQTEDQLQSLAHAGVSIWRINLKHETLAIQIQRIETALQTHQGALLIDLQGPQVRVFTHEHQPLSIVSDQVIEVRQHPGHLITIPTPEFFGKAEIGDTILLDDGNLEFGITGKEYETLWWQAKQSGQLKNGKTVTLVGKVLDTPAVTETDLSYLKALGAYPIDFVALSFVRSARDIKKLRQTLKKLEYRAAIIAKIENHEALKHLTEIIEAADGVMVARGDLGTEVAIEDLAYWQKQIIQESRRLTKPVIVATEMLESMVSHKRPTRAEASDVANAVFDGTDSVMLSSETAMGQHPSLVVETMAKIAAAAERRSIIQPIKIQASNGADILVQMAMNILERQPDFPVDQFLVFTSSGYTAQALSAHRPKVPIIAITNRPEKVNQLSLSYGVQAFYFEFPAGTFTIPNPILHELKTREIIKINQKLVIIHGYHWQEPDRANTLSLIEVG